jgi:lipid-binding SYLF domain-containing protein
MNEKGMQKLNGDKVTLGADASIAAGPVGRTASAQTDVRLDAEILSWSRAKGLFAGLALDGATLRPDEDANRDLYGEKLKNNEILLSDRRPPAEAASFVADLNRYSHVEGSSADRMRKSTPK